MSRKQDSKKSSDRDIQTPPGQESISFSGPSFPTPSDLESKPASIQEDGVAWFGDPMVEDQLPTQQEITTNSHARKIHFHEPTAPKSRKKQHIKMCLGRKHGSRVANINGKLPASIKNTLESPVKARTSAILRALPAGTSVE
ncbi:hypothetical protein DVH05_027501 [Phytophthora capsici]|nr:hypothetical protein DVH05_027501 [Phytophthora capsici]